MTSPRPTKNDGLPPPPSSSAPERAPDGGGEDQARDLERFRWLASQAPVGIFQTDAKGESVFLNATWCELAGMDEASARGSGWLKAVHPEDRAEVQRGWEEAVRRGVSSAAEFRFLRRDGSVRWLEGRAVQVRDAHGAVAGHIGTVADITERKQAEAAMQRLAAIVESSDDAIISKNLDGIIQSWNAGAERLFGYTAAEAIGRSIMLLIPPGREDEEPGIIAKIRRGERVDHYETTRRRKDGKLVQVSLTVSPMRDGRGRVIGASKIARNITERKTAESEVSRQQKLYRAIGESNDYGIWVSDAAGNNVYANDSFLKLVGLSPEACAGLGWTGALHPDEIGPTTEAWRACVRAGSFWEREHRFKGADGAWHPVLARGVPIRDDEGRIAHWAGIHLDISAFKRVEKNLQTQTHMLELVNRLSSELVAERDLEKIVQRVTDAGREISGAAFGAFFYNQVDEAGGSYLLYTLSGAQREDFEKFGPPRNTPVFAPTFKGEGPVRIGDVTTDSRYGTMAPHHGMPRGHLPVRSYLAVPVVSRSGQVLGGLFFGHPAANVFTEEAERILVAVAAQAAIAIDNANLYAALERELDQQKRTQQALRESEQQLRLVTDNAIVYLAQCDRAYRLKFVNRPYAVRFGRTPAELVGRPIAELVGEAAFATFKPHIDEALRGRRVEFETEIPYEQFGKRWMRVIHEPERDAAGEVVGLVAVITDITARKQAEQEMETARDKAVAASRAKDDFLAALSHELRTPLNPVLLLASAAAGDASLPAEVREDFATIRKNVELEARLIDDLLDLTRITRGKLSLNLAAIDLHSVLRDAVETLRAEIEQKKLALTVELKAQETTVWGDAVRLQQVLWNVLKNAVKFTPEGGAIAVRSDRTDDGAGVRIEVIDTGIGMTAAERARAFEAFSQGDHAGTARSHRFGGVGLGLAISRMLMEMHRGTIEAHSDGREKGARFTITLPLLEPEEYPSPVATAAQEAVGEPVSGVASAERRVRILLVEDHDPTRAALAALLKRRSYEVVTAASVTEARARAEKGEIDWLISDVGLPDGDGYELMRELKERHGLEGVALTGYGMDHDVVRSQAAGFAVHLTKPVTIQALDRALAALARKRAG